MRVAAAFILLISLAVAFKLEKELPVFEDDPDEQYEPAEQDEPDEQDEPHELYEPAEQDEPDEQDEPAEQDEPDELYELDEPVEQKEDEDGNEVESLYSRIFPQNYCCTHTCFVTPPECYGRRQLYGRQDFA
ncbi:FK506-binding protein 3-like [Orbicella faveolata]|uniref:FK506-binding protein 3-like n=1 Tax=Orbicella faveolata TaxID=48498 RepID=UPI0009E3CDDC|nr:FK506-binding protein 3-like [Orbicella faveolata]XP_020620254.1 FK506-binding protein 3-like [Orbicella faveolata]